MWPMRTNKIFCLGDGYAHGHIWPEWPQILQALMPDHDIITGTGVGAGNEFLIDQLLNFDVRDSQVIFQWAAADRFDKLITDAVWQDLAHNDPVYSFNFEQTASGIWWLSSASSNKKIREYHDFFVQKEQAQLRLQHQQILVANYLENLGCKYWFTSTQQQESFCATHSQRAHRGKEIQPSPLLHFYFVTEMIKPALNLSISEKLQEKLHEELMRTTWSAYDPDRKEQWAHICDFIQT